MPEAHEGRDEPGLEIKKNPRRGIRNMTEGGKTVVIERGRQSPAKIFRKKKGF